MRAPGFWWRPPGLLATLLTPLSALYGGVAARRMRRGGAVAVLPVLCVGNVTVGGAGKTPTALALWGLLREMGRSPAFLLRGYGGRLPGPLVVDPHGHHAEDVGDEALLLARRAPTVVARDRPAGAQELAAQGADVVVMDDGLQNPSLRKTFSLAVFDGAVGIGNGRVLPAGPLRAPIRSQWPHIGGVVIVGPGAAGDRIAADAAGREVPVLRATLEPTSDDAAALAGRDVLAFAGIGRPEKFFATCRDAGLEVRATRAFPDHHPYTATEMGRLLDEAERQNLVPVTTEKDQVRLVRLAEAEPRLALVRTLAVELRFADPQAVMELLATRLLGRPGQPDGRGNARPSRRSTASGDT